MVFNFGTDKNFKSWLVQVLSVQLKNLEVSDCCKHRKLDEESGLKYGSLTLPLHGTLLQGTRYLGIGDNEICNKHLGEKNEENLPKRVAQVYWILLQLPLSLIEIMVFYRQKGLVVSTFI